MRLKQAASAVTIALCLTPGLVWAQIAQPTPQSDDPEAAALDDIIVTAQRRSERLQDVPVAVSALSAEFIDRNQVRSLQDLGASVPGLVVTSSVNYGSAPLSIRGVGGANGGGNVLADEPVAVYVDDAVVGRLRLSTADLIDIGGIEVLRGPQGTLYGRNSTAGAVLIKSAEPTEQFAAKLSGSAGSYDDYRLQGAVSGPLNADGTVLGRLAGGFSDLGGWGKNTAGGDNLNRGQNWQVRGFLRFQPTDALRFDLIADASHQKSYPGVIAVSDISNLRDETRNPAGSNVVTPYVGRAGLDALLGDNQFALNYPTFSEITGRNVTSRLTWDLGPAELTSISNYRTWRMYGQQDSDGTDVNPPTPIFVTGDTPNVGDNDGRFRDKQVSQELRLASTGDGRLGWLIGAFYYAEDNLVDPIRIRNRLAGPGGAGTEVTFTADQKTRSWAAFANVTYALTDALKLTLGGRYNRETKDIVDTQLVTTINQFDPPGPVIFTAGQVIAPLSTLVANRTDENFSPRVVLDYKLNPDTLLYASYSKGFKSGGYNAFRGVDFAFEPEEIDAYEVGFKSDLTDTLRLNGSAYRYSYRDLQVRTPVASGGVGIESAEEARVQGVELEATFVPVVGLRFDANLAYVDAQFESGTLTAIAQPSWVFGTNPAIVQENIAGNTLTRAPEFQGAISGKYTFPIGPNEASIQGTVRHQGEVFFLETQQQQSTFRGAPWTEADARIALASPDGLWEVALYGKNLFDDRHLSQTTAFFGLPNASVNDPRRFGIQFAVKY